MVAVRQRLCRDCQYSIGDGRREWECENGLDPKRVADKCSGFICGERDKVTGVNHRRSKCFVCGKPVYSNTNDLAIYCEDHKWYSEIDEKILDEAPMELLFGLIASIFSRARDDYLFDVDGNKKDAEAFLRSEWASELSLWNIDADEVIRILDEVIENGAD